MKPSEHDAHVVNLHELVTGTDDIRGVLEGVTRFASASISEATGADIDCALTLRRHKRTSTVAGSNNRAVVLDRIEQTLNQGPCLDALDLGRAVLLDDVEVDISWPRYSKELKTSGIRSVLGVPMPLTEQSQAVLNFFAPLAGIFTDAVITKATDFADVAGKTLRLAVRLETVEQLNLDLKTAMSSRTIIDLACGAIMAQNRCPQETAFNILTRASNHRNEKVSKVALDLIDRLSGGEKFFRFED